MCQFGDESKILEELNLTEDKALFGWRDNYIVNPFNDKEKYLKALNQEYLYPKKSPAIGDQLTRDNSAGIYNYYNYNYNYYNYNYYYNTDNNYYNNYNYYYNYYNNNNYNNNNYVQIQTRLWGKVFKYSEGYRSEFAYPTLIVCLDKDSKWFIDVKTKSFAEHFNSTVEKLAEEYGCGVVEFSKRDNV